MTMDDEILEAIRTLIRAIETDGFEETYDAISHAEHKLDDGDDDGAREGPAWAPTLVGALANAVRATEDEAAGRRSITIRYTKGEVLYFSFETGGVEGGDFRHAIETAVRTALERGDRPLAERQEG